MNTTFKTLAAIFLVATMGSCEDYLDIDPQFTQDAENYFTSPTDYELALIGAYDLLQTSYLTQFIGEIASDNSIAGGESVTDSEGLHQIENMTHGGENQELLSVFRFNYAGIARCNYIMENKDNIDFSGKNEILAQTRFLRAYYYFQLVKYFGDVPLIIDRRLGAQEVTETERTPKSEVYAQIEADLNFAINNLPMSNPVKGRVEKGAAEALLGKVYLYQKKYGQAATTLGNVITSGQYDLVPNFNDIWKVANEGNQEVVFDIQYTGLEGGSYDCFVCLEGNAAVGFHGIRQYSGPVYGDGNSYNLPTQNLYNAFDDATDTVRRAAAILDIDTFVYKQAQLSPPVTVTYAVGGGGHTGYYNNKYIKRVGEIGLPDNDLTSPLNYIVIRYADVLLMAAEALNETGQDGVALTYLNQVRARAGVPPRASAGAQLKQDILYERRVELAGEGLRFFDLVRTGQAANNINNFVTGKHELFPIPQVEIDLAGGNWSQNPMY